MKARTTDPDVIMARLKEKACVECGLVGMETDPDTGFAFHYCAYHRVHLEPVKSPADVRMTLAERNAHKKAGLDMLDQLMAQETA